MATTDEPAPAGPTWDPGELQAYLETLWHRVDADADAARLTLLLDLIEAVPVPEAWAFALSRAEAIARRTDLPTWPAWRADRSGRASG